jgi:hypothetical protein
VVRSTSGFSERYHEKQMLVIGAGETLPTGERSSFRVSTRSIFSEALRAWGVDLRLRAHKLNQTHVTKAERGMENDLGN